MSVAPVWCALPPGHRWGEAARIRDTGTSERFHEALPRVYVVDGRFVGPEPIPELARALLAGELEGG
jgi:hypothetical protein